jgi:ABC-type branched-subunit amino acid transport system substrate-binding protein
MRRLVIGVLALVTVLGVCGAQDKEAVKIGGIFSISGDCSVSGDQFCDGALLRLKEQNSRQSLFDYKMIVEDDAGTQMRSVLAYHKLVSVDKCDVIFDIWAGPGAAIAPLAAKDRRLVINSSWFAKIADDPLAFIHCTQPVSQAELMARTLNGLGVKRVAVMYFYQQGAIAGAEAFANRARRLGMETKELYFNPGEIDFRGHLLKFHDFNPDAYMLITLNPEFEILLSRIKQSGFKGIVTSIEGFTYLDKLDKYSGYFFVEGNQPTDEFKKRYLAEAGKATAGYVGNGYDMMDLVIYAYETAGAKLHRKPTTAEAAEVLRHLKDYPGAIGPLTMGSNRVIQSQAVLKYIENGKAVPVTIEELKKKLQK